MKKPKPNLFSELFKRKAKKLPKVNTPSMQPRSTSRYNNSVESSRRSDLFQAPDDKASY